MGKRAGTGSTGSHARHGRDYYPTIDPNAVTPLIEHIRQTHKRTLTYWEPCAGNLALVNLLKKCKAPLTCKRASDIYASDNVETLDVFAIGNVPRGIDCFITNPPFVWDVLDPLIGHLSSMLPTWLLLPADYMHNVRMAKYASFCTDVLSVGRLRWSSNTKITGVDNYAWFRYDAESYPADTRFSWRDPFLTR